MLLYRQTAQQFSPIKMIDKLSQNIEEDTKIMIAVGQLETPEFIRQSQVFSQVSFILIVGLLSIPFSTGDISTCQV